MLNIHQLTAGLTTMGNFWKSAILNNNIPKCHIKMRAAFLLPSSSITQGRMGQALILMEHFNFQKTPQNVPSLLKLFALNTKLLMGQKFHFQTLRWRVELFIAKNLSKGCFFVKKLFIFWVPFWQKNSHQKGGPDICGFDICWPTICRQTDFKIVKGTWYVK